MKKMNHQQSLQFDWHLLQQHVCDHGSSMSIEYSLQRDWIALHLRERYSTHEKIQGNHVNSKMNRCPCHCVAVEGDGAVTVVVVVTNGD